jgi:hypothetical protein
MIKINAAARLKATQQAPTIPGRTSVHEDHSSREVFADSDDVIAPSMSYKEENEKELDKQQDEHQRDMNETNKPSNSDSTAVPNNASAALYRLRASLE